MTTIPIAPSHLHLLKIPAQILAITTSALFAGYTASLSLITVPMLLAHFGTPSSSSSATSKPPRSVSTTQTPTTPVADDHTSTGSAGVDTMDESVINDAAGMGSGDSKLKSPLSEALLLSQWRQMYVHGARTSRPATIIPVICYIFLIYTTIEEMTMKAQAGDTHYNERGAGGGRQLGGVLMWYCVALVGQCGIVVALTTLRRTNGALGRRCEKVLAPPPPELQDISLRYASNEARSIEREANITWTSERLVRRWKWHNDVRSVLLTAGVVAGVYAVVLDSRV